MKYKLLLSTLIIALLFSSCQREFSLNDPQPTATDTASISGTADYTLGDSNGSCAQAVVAGTYTAGVATTDANTITLTVTVDSTGTWAINTGNVNGIRFSGADSFATTGTQTIVLKASGTPTAAGTISLVMGSAACTITVVVAEAPSGGGVTGSFKAKIDGTQWVADKFAQGSRMNGLINVSGLAIDKKNISITVSDSGVHQYTLAWDNTSNSVGVFMDSAAANITAFSSNSGSTPSQAGGVLNITSIDEVNKTMSGTFSFKAYRPSTNETKNITEGVFTNIPYVTSISGNPSNTMSVKVDGALFTPPVVTGVIVLGSITVTGSTSGADQTVAISFPQTITAGVYTIGGMLDSYYGAYNPNTDPLQATISNSGTLEILEITSSPRRVKGKFSFTSSPLLGSTTYNLTEGVFDTTY